MQAGDADDVRALFQYFIGFGFSIDWHYPVAVAIDRAVLNASAKRSLFPLVLVLPELTTAGSIGDRARKGLLSQSTAEIPAKPDRLFRVLMALRVRPATATPITGAQDVAGA